MSSLKPESLPYFRELVQIRPILSIHQSARRGKQVFSHGCCNDTTRIVAALTGLEQVGGFYTYPNFTREQKKELSIQHIEHAWNHDKDRGLYIDLTLCQFDEYPKIAIIEPSSGILMPNAKLTKKQNEMELEGVVRVIEFLNHST